jgi:hypothetical protein
MNIAHDVFSEINPAFCACVLVRFVSAFYELREDGPELPVIYLSLPIALSGDLESSFDGTNKKTGLLDWLERSPQAQIELQNRLNQSLDIVTNAFRFGCFVGLLKIDDRARIQIGERKLKNTAIKALGNKNLQAIKRAERLGYWFASAGSTKTIFDAMGLTI